MVSIVGSIGGGLGSSAFSFKSFLSLTEVIFLNKLADLLGMEILEL